MDGTCLMMKMIRHCGQYMKMSRLHPVDISCFGAVDVMPECTPISNSPKPRALQKSLSWQILPALSLTNEK